MNGEIRMAKQNIFVRAYKKLPRARRIPVGLLAINGGWNLALRELFRPYLKYTATLSTEHGTKLPIRQDPTDMKVVRQLLFQHNLIYLPDVPGLPSKPIILDLGAHHGYYTLLALEKYPQSRVIAVEPSAASANAIQKNLAVNRLTDRVRVVQAALADHDGEGYLQIEKLSWSHALAENGSNADGKQVRVQLMTVHSILEGDRPHIIKCNAEGGEYDLVQALRDDETIRPLLIILMVHPDKKPDAASDILADLKRLGYDFTVVSGDDLRPIYHCWLREESTD
jgi:FkbM family methyltransferase